MRTYPEQLAQQLNQPLRQTYLVFGSDPLLKLEARDAICQAARTQGFEEHHRFLIDGQLNWQDVFDCCQALSLFSSRQIIELTCPENGLSSAQTKQLTELANNLHPDILLLVQGERLNKKQESAKWFTTLSKKALYVVCHTPDARHFPRFIEQRCRALHLQPDQPALQLLAQWHEGNLLALVQSLQILQLLYPDGTLTLPRIESALSRHHHFTPFQLTDALLAGKAQRAQRIVEQLHAEGEEPTLLLRLIQRELKQLYTLQEQGQQGRPLNIVFDQLRVWQTRRPMITAALKRLNLPRLAALLRHLAQLEIRLKTDFSRDPWPDLHYFCALMCQEPEPLAH
ncbi:DNA polymerase III subunit delta [Salinivibrio sp. ES.052]|uniref:DNA polymerase III subunit delta n=1 Tax=Salinivibrio sp. ES.052 TaxID=1882823 RepID=UPI0009413B5B|nr:DNA polymerase III subunit delta [Salinivibrio sp. ES.052]